jgi:hypothetical protein
MEGRKVGWRWKVERREGGTRQGRREMKMREHEEDNAQPQSCRVHRVPPIRYFSLLRSHSNASLSSASLCLLRLL